MLPSLPRRHPDSHKGDFGRIVLVGGSRGMSGSIALSGMAALRAGAGLVTLAVPDCCLDLVAAWEPCYMTVALPDDASGQIAESALETLLELADRADCMAIGPGLGRSQAIQTITQHLFTVWPGPMVVDADGLNALAENPHALANSGGERVLTPHLGEFQRLIEDPKLSAIDARKTAPDFSAQHRVVTVLKGNHTLVTDGSQTEENQTGNPGMATGGSGDVLTGIITALAGQGLPTWQAARLGVHLHGLAGDLAAEESGQVSLVATDIIDFLADAFLEHEREQTPDGPA